MWRTLVGDGALQVSQRRVRTMSLPETVGYALGVPIGEDTMCKLFGNTLHH